MAHTTNYQSTFITVSPDSPVSTSARPSKAGSVAALQYELLHEAPYHLTSDDVLFEVHRRRAADGGLDRDEFFTTAKACLRTSPLVRTQGFGLHHDAEGRVALVPMESEAYVRLAADPAVKVVAGMRRSRGWAILNKLSSHDNLQG